MRMTYLLALIPSFALATGGHEPPPKPTPPPAGQEQGQAQGQTQSQGQGQEQVLHNANTVSSTVGATTATGGAANAANQGVQQGVNFEDRLQAPAQGIPGVYPTSPCAIGWSAGLSVPGGALGGGKAKVDANCEVRENIRLAIAVNPALALKAICRLPGLVEVASPEDCALPPPPAPVVPVPVPVVEPVAQCRKPKTQCAR